MGPSRGIQQYAPETLDAGSFKKGSKTSNL